MDEFQECIEEYQECFEVVHICIDEERSFNSSPCDSPLEDVPDNTSTSNHNKPSNQDLIHHENNYVMNKANPEDVQTTLSESELELSFKSVNDTLTNNLINKICVREGNFVQKRVPNVHVNKIHQNDSSTQSDKVSTQSSKLTDDKDGYETCIDESLSEDTCAKGKKHHQDVLDLAVQIVDINKTDATEVQNFYADDKTPTNSPVNRVFPKVVNISTSEPCLNSDRALLKNNHICLDNKLDEDLKSYDNQDDSLGTDEFFLIQYPANHFSNLPENKSRSEPSIAATETSNHEFTSLVHYKQYLTECYANYQACWESCRVYSKRKSEFSRNGTEEISDDEIFADILLPFKSQSTPAVSDSAIGASASYAEVDRARRKSAFEPGRKFDTDR